MGPGRIAYPRPVAGLDLPAFELAAGPTYEVGVIVGTIATALGFGAALLGSLLYSAADVVIESALGSLFPKR